MNTWIERYWYILERVGSRYFMVAGVAFLLFYVLLRSRIAQKKIQRTFPSLSDYHREIFYSVLTIMIFGLIPLLLIFNPSVRPYTTLYNTIAERGWRYYVGIFPLMFLMHDTYFIGRIGLCIILVCSVIFIWCIISLPIPLPGRHMPFIRWRLL